jgi:hypothetical protein
MYEEKKPSIIEQLSEMMGFTKNNGVKTFVKKPDYSGLNTPTSTPTPEASTGTGLGRFFNPITQASASTLPNITSVPNNFAQQSGAIDPKSVIREGISKYINGDYPNALNYFLRAQNMPGETDPNLKEYIFKAQRMMQSLKEKGIM